MNAKQRRKLDRLVGRRLAAAATSRLSLTGTSPVDFAAAKDEASPGTFSAVVYTGGSMRPGGFGNVVVDLSKTRVAADSNPVLFHHDPSQIVGHGPITIEDGQITASGVLSGVGAASEEVRGLARNGFPMKASIGMDIEGRRGVGKGKSTRVNGRDFAGPVTVVWGEIGEFSFVPLAADKNTSTQIAASKKELETMDDFKKWLNGFGLDYDDLEDDQREKLQAKFDADKSSQEHDGKDRTSPPKKKELKADGPDTAVLDKEDEDEDHIGKLRAERVAELKREKKIRELCAGHEEIGIKAIEEGWDETRTELEVMRASRPRGPAIHSENGDNNSAETLEAALLMNCAAFTEDDFKNRRLCRYSDRTVEAALSSKMRNYSLHGLMYDVCQAGGKYVRPGKFWDDEIRTTFEANQALRASGFSTISLTGILSAVANKSAVRAFLAVPERIRRIAATRSLNDFKPHVSYRMTGVGKFLKVGADGEIKSMELEETGYSNQADTYARLVALNRQMIINDDLGMFSSINAHLGRKSAVTLERVGHEVFLNNATFFTTARGNYIEGAGTTLQISQLTVAEKLFAEQIDEDGDFIGVMAETLLVPTALATTADNLMASVRVVTGTGAEVPENNPHSGKWTVLSDPWLSVKGGITGGSDTAWYLLASPADVAAIEVGYVQGRQQPVIESADTDFNTLGVQTRGYFDFGFALQEYRGGFKSKGAA